MIEVLLSKKAQAVLNQLTQYDLAHSVALIVSPDPKTDTLLTRFVEKELLKTLKTRYLCEVPPGVEIHSFGLDACSTFSALEMTVLPVQQYCITQENHSKTEILMRSLFRVFLHETAPLSLADRPQSCQAC